MAKLPKRLSKIPAWATQAAVILVACAVIAAAIIWQTSHSKDDTSYYTVTNWSKETAKEYFDNCVYSALRPGSSVSDLDASTYCGCSIDALQTIYKSESELNQIKDWVQNGFPKEVQDVIRGCAQKAHLPVNS